MKNLKPIKGKYYIAGLIEEGEHEHQDFKFAVGDAAKIARSISAFANNDGGRLLIGVKDNGVIAGVRNDEDLYVVEQAAQMYCRPSQTVEFTPFVTDGGLIVVRAEIAKAEKRPVECRDDKGRYRAYYRVADENIPASALMVKAWRGQSDSQTTESVGVMFTPSDSAILHLIDPRDGLDISTAMRSLHISQRAAEDAIIRLFSIGLVDFQYIHGEFRIVPLPDNK